MFAKSFILSVFILSPSLLANQVNSETNKPAQNELVSIFASPYQSRYADVPASLYRLGPEDIQERQMSASLPDALAELPGVYVQKTGPGRSNPIIRGFGISRSVVVADGVRLNNPTLRSGPNEYWNTLDPYLYSNLELILGPGSLMYGSDAMGGVVLAGSNPLNRGLKDSELQLDGGDLFLRYGSAQESFSEHLKFNFTQDDNLAFSIGLTRQDFDDLNMANNNSLSHSGYEEMGVNFRLEYDLDSRSSFILGYDNYLVDDTNRVHKTIFGESFEGTSIGSDYERISDFHRQAAFTRYEFRDGNGFISEADISFSWQLMEEDYKRINTDQSTHSKNNFDDNTYGTNLRLKSETDLVDFTYGIDYYYDDIRSAGSKAGVEEIQGAVADDAKYQQLGLYLLADIPLSGINDDLSLVLGTRYNYADMDAGKVILLGNPGSIDGNWEAWTS
jgi:hemoglobin/transferrin/lactoferrin receptor protein